MFLTCSHGIPDIPLPIPSWRSSHHCLLSDSWSRRGTGPCAELPGGTCQSGVREKERKRNLLRNSKLAAIPQRNKTVIHFTQGASKITALVSMGTSDRLINLGPELDIVTSISQILLLQRRCKQIEHLYFLANHTALFSSVFSRSDLKAFEAESTGVWI